MSSERISCCIPGCRRTFKALPDVDDSETMCGRHWRMGDRRMRDRHKQLMRRYRRVKRLSLRKAIQARGEDRIGRVWCAVAFAANDLWARIREDVTIKAAFGVEDAPRRRPKIDA